MKEEKIMVNNFYSFCWNQCSARHFQEIIDFWQRSNLLESHLTTIASDLSVHVLLDFSHIAINFTVKLTANMHWLLGKVFVWTQCTKAVLTYKLLPMAPVSRFSLYWTESLQHDALSAGSLDTANLCSCRCLWALVPSGVSGSQFSTYHFIFERQKYQVRVLNCLKGNGVILMDCDLQKAMMQMYTWPPVKLMSCIKTSSSPST